MNYYFFSGKNAPKGASAFAPEGTKQDWELIPELENLNEMPFEFELVKLTVGRNGLVKSKDLSNLEEIWLDYQPNNLAWPMCSEKLRTIFAEHLTGNEGIDWLTAKVNGNGEQRIYYIPRFEKNLDVFDMEKCLCDKYGIIVPCFSLEKVRSYNIFRRPDRDKITSGFYISEALKKAIQKAKCSGVSFERTRVL